MKKVLIAAGIGGAALMAVTLLPANSPQMKEVVSASISPGDLTRAILGLKDAEASDAF
jgi:hypothetical protein